MPSGDEREESGECQNYLKSACVKRKKEEKKKKKG